MLRREAESIAPIVGGAMRRARFPRPATSSAPGGAEADGADQARCAIGVTGRCA